MQLRPPPDINVMIPDQLGEAAVVPQGATHLVIMGVAGSGKSTIATALAQELSWSNVEADDFHPQSNMPLCSVSSAECVLAKGTFRDRNMVAPQRLACSHRSVPTSARGR